MPVLLIFQENKGHILNTGIQNEEKLGKKSDK